jgi:UDP-N-acetylglucosamine diphosphorylase / glucose-1-phosphate thymidylyltransferase / UDP-N-acetylgalactosamine diphosphorylase / glucosamine-1-phosphate N-acetyltransferase / galactosamine-1-phosphate N-acetyltransferase
MLKPADFFDLSDTAIAVFFEGCDPVWEALPAISGHVARLVGEGQTILGEVMPGAILSERPLYIAEGARIETGAFVQGPAYIGPGAVVRHGAFVRENVILLAGAVLGHASEAKNSLFLPDAHAPHFNYVGDSILGRGVNLGAGTKLSNLALSSEKSAATGRRPSIKIRIDGVEYNTGLAKFGAILGDEAQTGCNAVLNPGCLVGRRTLVYANLSLPKGYYLPNSVVKLRQEIQLTPRF